MNLNRNSDVVGVYMIGTLESHYQREIQAIASPCIDFVFLNEMDGEIYMGDTVLQTIQICLTMASGIILSLSFDAPPFLESLKIPRISSEKIASAISDTSSKIIVSRTTTSSPTFNKMIQRVEMENSWWK
jgi:hypothetical protein